MRSQQTARRVQNSVMKSPSPDIANKNIIKDTVPPIEDVKRYLEKSAKSRSPRVSQLSQSAKFQNDGSEIEMLRQRIKQLEHINMQIMSENDKLRRDAMDKSALQGQLLRMRQTIRSIQGSQSATPRSGDGNRALQQMQQRVMRLLNENNRIGTLLQDKQISIQTLANENRRLKQEVQANKYRYQPSTSTTYQSSLQPQNTDLIVIRNFYESRVEPEMRRSQTEWMNRIRQLSERLGRIQQNQDYIEKQIIQRSNVITPIKPNDTKTPFSNRKTTQDPNQSLTGIQLPQSVRPFESMTMRSTNKDQQEYGINYGNGSGSGYKQYEDIIKQLENRNRNTQKENQNCRKKIVQLEGQLRRAKDVSSIDVKFSGAAVNQEYLRKIRELQQELDNKIFALSGVERDLKSTRQDMNRLKQRTDRQIYLLQNQRNTCKKAFEQQRQKSTQSEQTISRQNERLATLQIRIKQKQSSLQQQRQKESRQNEQKQISIKKYYQDLLKNKDKSINQQLHQYLIVLNNIRKDIQDADGEANGVIGEIDRVSMEKIGVQSMIQFCREENQRIIADIKAMLIRQEQRIIELEKDNNMLHAQIRQLQSQKQKLKKAMLQFQGIKLVSLNSVPGVVTTTTSTTTTTFKKDNCKLKSCLKQTIKKIDSLEHQITQILME